MPYSTKRIAEHSAKMFLRKIEDIVDETVNITAEQIVKDMSQTFDKCIDDFYRYETKSYYRHEVGKGTGTGWNLYLANQFRVNYSGGNAKSIHFGWSNADELMSPYKIFENSKQGIEHVIDSVMNGVRFDGNGSSRYQRMEWRLSSPITTLYFGTLKGTTPNQIFNQMLNKIEKVQETLASKNFNRLYKTLKK